MVWMGRTVALTFAAALASCIGDHSESDSDSRYSVVITAFDSDWKTRGIKTIRAETGLGLANAKRLIEGNRSIVKAALTLTEANILATRLRAQRISVELQPEQ